MLLTNKADTSHSRSRETPEGLHRVQTSVSVSDASWRTRNPGLSAVADAGLKGLGNLKAHTAWVSAYVELERQA